MHPWINNSPLDTVPCGFVSFMDDGTMAAVNLTLAEMLGYSRVDLEGWHLQKILPAGGRVFYNTHVFPILKMHGRAEEIYIALRTKDGRDLPVLMNAVRRERRGNLVNDAIFVRMIQRHEYEEQLLQARRLAEQANAAKARFLSMMSHDLRTPLTAVSGHAELLATGMRGALSDDQRDSVGEIKQASRELSRMIDDILSFAQLESGRVKVRPEPVLVRDAVGRAESLIKLRVSAAQLSYETESFADDVAVLADPDRLQQILLNLLTNAIKFTAAGGRVSVSCDRTTDRVLIRVRDTGVGIPADELQRVFDPFVQLDAKTVDATQRGVGLGLAISRELARAMNGDVAVESTLGKGSVFTVELPGAVAVLAKGSV